MAKNIKTYSEFSGGISDYTRESRVPDSFAFARSIDYRSDPTNLTLLPRTIKESGSVVIDLPKWASVYTPNVSTYIYGDQGNIYKRLSDHTYSNLRTVANSHGNGMDYFAEDDFLYYTSDSLIGRYGPLSSSSPTFTDDYFGSQGGVPLNTASLDLEASSSQYASRADTASLSITGDITLEAQIKPESLPTAGNSMSLISKWDESGATRSYKFDINAVSGYFGDGSDSSLTISSNTTEAPIDSACTGTVSLTSLSATNASFASGQLLLIHQTRGTNAGTWMRNKIVSYTAGTITLETPLNASYTSGAQVRVMKQYTNVTVNSGVTYTAKAWDGTVGGILAFVANGTVTVTGSINATGKGFRGGTAVSTVSAGKQGEGTGGAGDTVSSSANGNGGGGGMANAASSRTGGSGGNALSGSTNTSQAPNGGTGGSSSGAADLTSMTFGGGGGSGGAGQSGGTGSGTSGAGGNGGGIVFITGTDVVVAGSIISGGSNGGNGSGTANLSGGSGGAGGSILVKAQTATLGTALITTPAGAGGTKQDTGSAQDGLSGSVGIIHLDYYTSYTGTTTPNLDVSQDDSLVTNLTYQLRLAVSSTGSNTENLTRPINVMLDTWQQVAVSWDASASTAEFFLNSVSLGTATGTLTAISDNGSTFQVGMHKDGAGAATSFYDGLIDEVRVWSVLKTAADLLSWSASQTAVNLSGLNAYYKLNGDYVDATSNANNLTATNTPVFVSDVPFASPTTRLDIDQSPDPEPSGNTYTTPVSISETTTNRLTFTPEKDPQKSIAVKIAAVGTGNWSLIVHDQYNNLIATKTVANASLSTGYYEFVFSDVWRPLLNQDYHFHVISTVADGTVVTGTSADLETVAYYTYWQFLVGDSEWHPVGKMLQKLVIGNERYVGTYEATLYDPMTLTLPAGFRVRCFGYWNEYLAIGAMQGDNVYSVDSGRVYFWDGVSDTYNFFVDIPEGAVNALIGTKGHLYIWAGYQGDMLDYVGGAGADKVKRIPLISGNNYVDVFPGAVAMWQSLIRFGVAGASDSTEIQKGAYSYGSINLRYPNSLSFDFPVSTGTYTGTGLKIGMLKVVNRQLIIGWQDGTAYGVDYVDLANACYPTGSIEFMIEDEGAIWKEKEAVQLSAMFLPLIDGQSVNVGYKINSGDTYTRRLPVSEVDQTSAQMQISDGRYREIQCVVDLATTTSATPTFLGLAFERDLLQPEQRVGGTNG